MPDAMPAMISLPFITIFIVHALLVTCTKDTLDLRRSDSNGTDIILAGAQNTSHPILLSSDGAYAWQFFSRNGDLTKRLLVVLRVLFNTSIVVWIANRDHPASPDASLLLELPLRRLTLRERNGAVVWSPAAVNISSIVMNTNGSLHILGEAGALQWQSFDEPADVLVPGQYLLTNHTATSSISVTDWTTGFYTLKADPGGMVLYATFDAQQTMIPYQIFNYIRENDTIASSLYSNCNHTIIIYDKDGSGITLEQSGTVTPQCLAENNGVPTINGVFFPNRIGNDSGYRFLRISPIGDLVTFYISNFTGLVQDNELFRVFYNTYCKFPSYCGAYGLCSSIQNCSCPQLFEAIDPSDPTQGCQRQTPLNCSNFEHHQFLQVPGTDYYANDYLTPQKVVQDPTECTNLCLQSCSCSAAFYNNNTGACHLYDQLRTMQYLANPNVIAFLRVTSLPGTGQSDKMVIRNQVRVTP
ncbi:hypothetical protein KP509_1Z180500 [Ceratopteris richardii]|nr:hypothetical protein KP509_1Z180500 [Ceratopteris richardii]